MNINRNLMTQLQDCTTDVEYLLSPKDALDSLFRRRYCLIVLSMELSELKGLELLQALRLHHSIPILVLSKNRDTDAKVRALQSGADAFITKPLDLLECQATVDALIRRYTELGGDLERPYALTVGGSLIIDPQYRCVMFEGVPIKLSKKEFDILYFLIQHSRQVFSHEQIYSQIWHEDVILDIEKTVRYHIQSLRKKLDFLSDIAYIETVWGVGFRFIPYARE